ncbi:MAG: rhomboid family intramembrane serine protease [Allosphingosinicella sp.]
MRPPDDLRAAPVTLAIAALTAAAWLIAWLPGWSQSAAVEAGFIPARVAGLPNDVLHVPVALTPLTATLVHSGLPHLAVSLFFLLFSGRSVEKVLGRAGMIILYLVGAYAAAAAQYAVAPHSVAPLIGAGGAISAPLGAYALLFSRNRGKTANHRLATLLHALWLAAAWIGVELLVGLTFETSGERFPVAAYAAGFLVGMLLAKPLLLLKWRGA